MFGYFLFYYLVGHGRMPIGGIVILASSLAVDLVFFFDLFIVDQGYLIIKFVLNPFKKNLKIRLEDIARIQLKTVGVKIMRTGICINIANGNTISFLIYFTEGEIIRFMKRVKAEGIDIVHANMQDEDGK